MDRTGAGTIPADLLCYDRPALQEEIVRRDRDGTLRTTVTVAGLRCGGCVRKLEKAFADVPGLADLNINLSTHRAEIAWRPEQTHLSRLLAAFADQGHPALPFRPDREGEQRSAEFRGALVRLGIAGLASMFVMMFAITLYAGEIEGIEDVYRDFFRWVSFIVTAPVVFISARPFFAAAWRDVSHGRFGMDVPVSLAIASGYAASLLATVMQADEVYYDSVTMFVFFLSIGRFLEMRARHRAADAVTAVLQQTPSTATRLAEGRAEIVATRELVPGDHVLVKPGESIPADGRVLAGESSVNEAMLTGEYQPRRKSVGDAVIGGTMNEESPLTVVIEKVGGQTVLGGILRLLDKAASARPAIAQLADRVAGVFVPSVLVLTALVAVIWWHIDPERWFWITLAVLVVTCPCALSLATPAALTAASRGMLARGLMVLRSHVIESLAKATHVVFDKTGTLTEGRFRLSASGSLGRMSAVEALRIASVLEAHSEHPIARAFRAEGGAVDVGEASGVTTHANCGVEGSVGGEVYRIGKPAWVAELSGVSTENLPQQATVALGGTDGLVAWFELADTLRPEAASVVRRLHDLGIVVEIASGDGSQAPHALAARLGIETVVAGASPADKLAHVRALQERGAVVVMVGDGVNDAPSLGGAHLSIAMGGGTDLAMSRADSVLLKDDLGAIADAIELARRTRVVIVQNLTWAAGYNLLALPLAATGMLAPYWAALGMSASSLLVVSNALRLGPRLGRKPAPATPQVRVEQPA